jgi:hypothetical protein
MHDVSFLLSAAYLIVSSHQELLKRRLTCDGGGGAGIQILLSVFDLIVNSHKEVGLSH